MTNELSNILDENNEKLLQAATEGNYQETKQLLEQGVNPNTPVLKKHIGWDFMETYYPLLHAVENRHMAIVKLLVESGADVNVATKGDGKTPLHAAMHAIKSIIQIAGFGDVHRSKADHELVKYLVEHGANSNAEGGFCLTPFLLAIYNDDQELVEYFISKGADINLELQHTDLNESRDTALGAAVQESNKAIVQLLLNHGAKPKADTIEEAFKIGNAEIIAALLASGTDTYEKNNVNNTALIYAARYGNIDIVTHLLKNSANINAQEMSHDGVLDGDTALIAASHNGHTDIVKLLLDKGADIDTKVYYCGDTALMKACGGGYIDIVKLLLDKGAQVNSVNEYYGFTALMKARRCGFIEIVQLLLDNGADINSIDRKDQDGYTALMNAIRHGGSLEVIQLLLQQGAGINARDKNGYTALMVACLFGKTEITKLLLQNGAESNISTESGNTALGIASRFGHTEIVKLLLQNDAHINSISTAFGTPLRLACSNGHTEIVKLLLQNGADVNIVDSYGTPLITACGYGYCDIVKLLLEHGADVNLPSHSGQTPLMATCQFSGNSEIIKWLLDKGANINLVDKKYDFTALK